MNPLVELNLALVLFLPWFLILGALFWIYPRTPRGARRRAFDVVALALGVVAFVYAQYWAQDTADRQYGHMWPQILATSVGYGAYLGVMALAFAVRMRLMPRLVPPAARGVRREGP
jgi:hypothetical protein